MAAHEVFPAEPSRNRAVHIFTTLSQIIAYGYLTSKKNQTTISTAKRGYAADIRRYIQGRTLNDLWDLPGHTRCVPCGCK